MPLADDVLAHYPDRLRGPIAALGNHGGFSGARIFRVSSDAGALCLRAWPIETSATQLDFIHALMRRANDAGLDFVPRLVPTTRGDCYSHVAGCYWELATWMPGTAAAPTPERAQAAATALARLHQAWSDPRPRCGPCPAVARRLAVVRDWRGPIAGGWQPSCAPLDPVAAPAQRAWAIVRRRLPQLPALLEPWRLCPLPLQPCLCDVRPGHVLFTEDRVTGLVDFGSCKVDHVAVDLARLFGEDRLLWATGLDAYAQHRPLSNVERALARDLDCTGVVVAAANWLRWLFRERRAYPDRAAVAQRLAALVERLA
jgi:Ser/Thr protein kinase RdoA (MazF antagonist)